MTETVDSSVATDTDASKQENPSNPNDVQLVQELKEKSDALRAQIRRKIVGQERVVELLLIALFARGHGLFVGVPGLAKTLLIQTLAEGLGLSFSRIQFTPDLMPFDITGTEVLEENRTTGERSFRFIKGPLFAHVVLADEINRTPPKTQSALLQAMQEHNVTAGGVTHHLGKPFHVFATQNPIEQEGTYPLPEAQLDRFMFMIEVGYPSAREEMEIVMSTTGDTRVALQPVLSADDILKFQELVRRIPVPEHVVTYAVRIVRATRPEESKLNFDGKNKIKWGAGPRASQYLVLAAKARAALQGRFAVSADDIRDVAVPVLSHRIVTHYSADVSPSNVVQNLLKAISVPKAGESL